MMVPIDPPELVDRVVMLHQEALDNIQAMSFNCECIRQNNNENGPKQLFFDLH
jgi:hypothetical protein